MVKIVGTIFHPVDHIAPAVVESLCFELESHRRTEVCTKTEGAVLFGAERGITEVGRTFVIQVGERRETQGAIPRGVDAPRRGRTIGKIDAGVEAEAMVDHRVALRQSSERERPIAEHKIVFEEIAEVRAVGATHIVGRPTIFIDERTIGLLDGRFSRDANVLRGIERETEIRGMDALLTKFRTESRATECPLRPSVQAEGEDIATMEVFGGVRATDELEIVVAAHPRNLRREVDTPFRFGFQTKGLSLRALPLIGETGRIESACPKVVGRETILRIDADLRVVVTSEPKEATALEIAVANRAIGARVRTTDARGETSFAPLTTP